MAGLKAKFGARFDGLSYVERVALALAGSEGTVNHGRLRAVTTEHPVDLSKTLQHLTQAGMLESTGGRGAVYHLPGETIPTPDDVFGPPALISVARSPDLDVGARKVSASSPILAASLPNLARSLPNLGSSSPDLPPSLPNLESISPNLEEKRDANGCLMADLLALPIIDDLSFISSSLRTRLEEMAVEPRTKRKIGRDPLRAVILQLCAQHFVTLR